jgi:small nuclear ribonucleoprotein (snRNP)-like protein
MLRGMVLCLLLCSVSRWVKADQVTLSNGDRLTGEIVKSDGKTLTLKTESAGTVEIKWSAIKAMSSDKPVYVETTSTKKTYSGIIGSQDDSLVVTSPTNQTATVTKADVAALRSAD